MDDEGEGNEKWSAGGVGIGCALVALAAAVAIIGVAWAISWENIEVERAKHRPALEQQQ